MNAAQCRLARVRRLDQNARVTDSDLAAQPNDAYFKAVFSVPENAAAFFQHHLPASVAALIQWKSLALIPGSFVKHSLQQAHSDLLFSAQTGSRPALLYLLFEHQTSVDAAMPLRLLSYVLEILQNHEAQHGLPLPPIIPFVLHQGPERWTVSENFADLFDLPPDMTEALLPYLPQFRHALLDLSRFDPARDEHHAQMRVVLLLMKLAREKRLLDFFAWIAANLVGQVLPDSLLRTSLLYALNADSSLDLDTISHTLESNTSLKEKTMSIASRLIASGEARGEARGVWIGKVQVLEQLMGLPVTPRESFAGLDVPEIERAFGALQARYAEQFKQH